MVVDKKNSVSYSKHNEKILATQQHAISLKSKKLN
jgi:hypothetical protein